ncbi:acyl-CoA synthetase [Pseudonocardia sulfidoxydans NBRC 16205]|uniref:Acyl-CoA synthetase n=2 Tax=Pseudonocardia sulfidoxydans TaxID=54011 RepID=A0A511DQE6_9PSEU|nr:acyl-CoA synthetase [Pseudonocardia sulfidoxydans NBRC 16205]
MRILDTLARSAWLYPDHAAVAVVGGPAVSYFELHRRALALAEFLRSRGIRRGDRIALLADNGLVYFDLVTAAAAVGAAVVPISTKLVGDEIRFIVADSAPALGVADDRHVGDLRAAAGSEFPLLTVDDDEYVRAVSGPPLERAHTDKVDESDTALILYTSGTTGRPKGVCLSQRALTSNGLTLCLVQRQRPTDVFMTTTPLYHAAAGTRVVSMLTDGQTHVVLPSFDVPGFLDAVREHRVTSTVLVPTQLQRILDAPELDVADLSSLRLIVYGAAPSAAGLAARAMTRLGVGMYQGYGLTEATTNLTALLPEDHTDGVPGRLDSCGRPVPGVMLELRNDAGEPVPVGQPGEIWVRADKIMSGYWNAPELTAEVMRDGWLCTGDLARLDEAGYLYIVGRSKEMLISGGVNVYPREIERVLELHPAVVEAAVVGVPDDRWGEVPVAFVQTAGPGVVTVEELLSLCEAHLSRIKRPTAVHVMRELPRTAVGKVRKVDLQTAVPS